MRELTTHGRSVHLGMPRSMWFDWTRQPRHLTGWSEEVLPEGHRRLRIPALVRPVHAWAAELLMDVVDQVHAVEDDVGLPHRQHWVSGGPQPLEGLWAGSHEITWPSWPARMADGNFVAP